MLITTSVDVVFISQRVDRREQNRICKTKDEVTNNKRLRLRDCNAKADRHSRAASLRQ